MVFSRRLKVLIALAVAALVLAASAFVILRHLQTTHYKVARLMGKPIPVQVAVAKVGHVDEQIPTEGTAKEFEIVPLAALTSGKVLRINARLGDVVKKGQRLAELDGVPLLSQLDMSRSQRDTSRKQLDLQIQKTAVMQELFDRQFVARDELDNALLAKLAAEQSLALNENAVVQATVNLNAARIDSPVSGIVTVRNVYVGTVVTRESPIMTVAQIDPILIQAPYTEDKIRYIHIGQSAKVSFYAFPGRFFEGKVQWINPVIDNATRLMTVQVALPNAELQVRPGMRGIVRLNNQQSAALRIPSIALLSTNEDFAYVFVVRDGVARVREIRIGAYAEGYMEVKSGLEPGEQVVIVGQLGLKDNDKVLVK